MSIYRGPLLIFFAGAVVFAAALAADNVVRHAPTPPLPTPTPIAGTAPLEGDVDQDGQISILDLTKELMIVATHYAERTICVVRSIYPTPPADARPGCEWQWIIHASDLP